MNIAGIIVAAGSGKRFGLKKQFVKLKEKTVLSYSVDVLKKLCSSLVVVTQKEDADYVKKLFPFLIVVDGGKERMNSVYNGLLSVSCDLVLIHDAARPLIDERIVTGVIRKALDVGCAIPVLKVAETVKKIENDRVVGSIDREGLYLAQTPQVFDYSKLRSAYENIVEGDKIYTDESSIWEEFYGACGYVKGSRKNIKITFAEDLEVARCLLG